MDDILGVRPFVPARDFARSIEFYEALGFLVVRRDSGIAILRLRGSSFILQNFYIEEHASNCIVQLAVRDADACWASLRIAGLGARFAVREPVPPTMQHWGLKVGFIFDPSGVLWHIAEVPG